MPNRWAGSVFQMVTETENLCTLRAMLLPPPSRIFITLSTAAKIVTARLNSRHTSWLQQLLWHFVLLPLLCLIVTLSFNCGAYGLLSLVSYASPACCFRRYKMVAAGRSHLKKNKKPTAKIHAAIFHLHLFKCGNCSVSKYVFYLAFTLLLYSTNK